MNADGPHDWHVTACVGSQLTDTQRDQLTTAVADAVRDLEDTWDGPHVHVSGTQCHHPSPAVEAEQDRLRADRDGRHPAAGHTPTLELADETADWSRP